MREIQPIHPKAIAGRRVLAARQGFYIGAALAFLGLHLWSGAWIFMVPFLFLVIAGEVEARRFLNTGSWRRFRRRSESPRACGSSGRRPAQSAPY